MAWFRLGFEVGQNDPAGDELYHDNSLCSGAPRGASAAICLSTLQCLRRQPTLATTKTEVLLMKRVSAKTMSMIRASTKVWIRMTLTVPVRIPAAVSIMLRLRARCPSPNNEIQLPRMAAPPVSNPLTLTTMQAC